MRRKATSPGFALNCVPSSTPESIVTRGAIGALALNALLLASSVMNKTGSAITARTRIGEPASMERLCLGRHAGLENVFHRELEEARGCDLPK
jgi:hypothetical protein